MAGHTVAIIKYEEKLESVRKAIELSDGFQKLKAGDKVVIKPNVVFWSQVSPFPKWGVITTSRVIEDVVTILKEQGVNEITIVEGVGTARHKDDETYLHAHESLGYNKLKERYGVKVVDIFVNPFDKVDLGEGVELKVNADIVNCDFVVNIPALKTHAQAVVSLGAKNLKGVLDINSRKKCHGAEAEKNLNYMISRLPEVLPPSATILDGIYTLERGPSFDGKPRRSNLIIASSDLLSADMVGAKALGYSVSEVPHLAYQAERRGRPDDLSDIEIKGQRIEDVAAPHEYGFAYDAEGPLPKKMAKMGIKGLSYHKYDLTMCTYCSGLNGVVLTAISMAWKGEPWDDVEVLTGKIMKPTPGKKKTILLGQCMYKLHKDNPDINEMIPIKGCPPDTKAAAEAFNKAGIPVDPAIMQNFEAGLGIFMARYKDRPEFEESFYTVE